MVKIPKDLNTSYSIDIIYKIDILCSYCGEKMSYESIGNRIKYGLTIAVLAINMSACGPRDQITITDPKPLTSNEIYMGDYDLCFYQAAEKYGIDRVLKQSPLEQIARGSAKIAGGVLTESHDVRNEGQYNLGKGLSDFSVNALSEEEEADFQTEKSDCLRKKGH